MGKKRVKIILILSLSTALMLMSAGIISMVSTKEKREELISFARKMLERPVKREMAKAPQKTVQPDIVEEKKAPAEILVDDFEIGQTSGIFSQRKNRVGSYQGTWAMRPSYSIITKSSTVRRGNKGHSLVIDYKKESGWAGYYTLLNNIDVTPYNTLSFWVKGENGGEKFDVGLADARMQDLEIDAFFLGSVTSFIKGGFVTKEWKEVKVPLARASSEINLSKMGSMVLWFRYGGTGRIYMQDIKFKNDPDVSEMEKYNEPQAAKDPLHERALWVWKIDPVSSKTQRRDLFALCQKSSYDLIYLFFPEFTEMPEASYLQSLSEYLRESHKLGIKVEALTGNPVWSLSANHHMLLNWIKFFLEYNKPRPEEERLDGVSLDVEPYLTAEWEKDKERIKADYIELLRKCRELVDGYGQKFKLGVATPFFYDKEDEGNFERSIFKYMDYIALMDYYDTPKEIINHGIFHVKLASEMKRKVMIGLETQDLVEMHQGKRYNTFIEEGWEEMWRVLDVVAKEFANEPSFEGFAMHHYDSYKLMTRGRNVPTKDRTVNYTIKAKKKIKDPVIDGNLDDWDLSAPYEVNKKDQVVYGGGAWRGPQDLSYKIYTMWDEEKFYIALDVTDDKLVAEKTGADMWEGDHAELWLDVDCEGDWNEAINSNDDFQIGLNPGNFSTIPPEVFIWTPTVSEDVKYKDLIVINASRKTDGYVIEASVPKEVLFSTCKVGRVGVDPKKPEVPVMAPDTSGEAPSFHKDYKMGIMVDMGDTDDPANPMKLLMSTSESRIWGDPTTFGVVIFEGDQK